MTSKILHSSINVADTFLHLSFFLPPGALAENNPEAVFTLSREYPGYWLFPHAPGKRDRMGTHVAGM